MKTKKFKPKKLIYELIRRDNDHGRALYAMLSDLVDDHHSELRDAKIALAWNRSWKPDVDGRKTLGKCKKASDLDRELVDLDFVIILNEEFVTDPSVLDSQRIALLDHELCHGAVKYDGEGEPVRDARGRLVYRIRKHDIEEFQEIVSRHGCYKRDLEHFARALDRARQQSLFGYVGYQSLQKRLAAAGLSIPLDTIVGWKDAQRRQALAWIVLRQELAKATKPIGAEPTTVMPAFLAAAVPPLQPQAVPA